jgi:hypothetical protein
MRNAYGLLMGKSEGKRPLEYEEVDGNAKMDLGERM